LSETLASILSAYLTFSLSDLEETDLLKRIDDKYFFHLSKLESILNDLKDKADMLEIDGVRSFQYSSTYLDTAEFDTYIQHHNNRKNRFKLRYRDYLDSDLQFLEIKEKDVHGIMHKYRIPLNGLNGNGDAMIKKHIKSHTPYQFEDLHKTITISYDRITLMDKNRKERLTIDRNLKFLREGKAPIMFKNLVIVELKHQKSESNSIFKQCLRKHGIRRQGISKYCLGISSLYDHLKDNSFKAQQRAVQKIESND